MKLTVRKSLITFLIIIMAALFGVGVFLAVNGGSAPAYAAAAGSNGGRVEKQAAIGINAPVVALDDDVADLRDLLFTAEEEARIENGENARIYLEIYADKQISEEEKSQISSAASGEAQYLELSLYKKIGTDEAQKITETENAVSVTLEIPAKLRQNCSQFKIVRLHGGTADTLESTLSEDNRQLKFSTDKFSTYALVYTVENVQSLMWVVIVLAVVVAIEAIIFIVGLIKRKKGAKHAHAVGLLAALPMGELAAVIVLAVVAVALLVAIVLVFKPSNKRTGAKKTSTDKLIEQAKAERKAALESQKAAEKEAAAAAVAEKEEEPERESEAQNKEEQSEEDPVKEAAHEPLITPPPVIPLPQHMHEKAPAQVPAGNTVIELTPQEVAEGVVVRPTWTENVLYNFSFRARLIQSDADTIGWYNQLMAEIHSYAKVKVTESYPKVNVKSGWEHLAMLVFRGRTLCMAFALDPKDYEDDRLHGEDVGDKKMYTNTPMLIRITSNRKVGYAKELLAAVAEKNGLERKESDWTDEKVVYEEIEPLLERGLIKKVIQKKKVKYTDHPLDKVTIVEAQQLMTDDEAATLVVSEPAAKRQVRTGKAVKGIVNIDDLSAAYKSGDTVTVENLIKKGLISPKVNYVKVLARGELNKKLDVRAQAYSLDAVKMIIITGGSATKV